MWRFDILQYPIIWNFLEKCCVMSMAGSCVDSSQYENKERKYNSN